MPSILSCAERSGEVADRSSNVEATVLLVTCKEGLMASVTHVTAPVTGGTTVIQTLEELAVLTHHQVTGRCKFKSHPQISAFSVLHQLGRAF